MDLYREMIIRKFNALYGEYQGEEFSILRNYYNKPLATINWDWEISSNVTLATSLYASAGRGGGTGLRGRGSYGTTSLESLLQNIWTITQSGEILTIRLTGEQQFQKT
jgi:hypothetical protein